MHSFNWLITQVDQAGLQVIEISLPLPWVLGLKACATAPSIPLFPRLTLNSQTLLRLQGAELTGEPLLVAREQSYWGSKCSQTRIPDGKWPGISTVSYITGFPDHGSSSHWLLPPRFWLRVLSSIASMPPSVLEFTVSSQAHNKVASSSHLCPSFLTMKSGIPQAT